MGKKAGDITEYKLKGYRGVDDLLSEYAFRGNSQGDESASNEISDYISSKGWMSFMFGDIDKTNQEAIYKEVERRKQQNLDYIDKLVREGRYKEEYEITISLAHNPIFDEPSFFPSTPPLESYRVVLLDISKNNENKSS